MIEVSKILLLVFGELFLVSIVAACIVVYLMVSKHQRDRAAMRTLVARIKEDSGRREQETRKIMEERYGFTGVDLEEIVKKIAREEKAFYQVLLDVYLKRNADALQNLSVDYEGSVETYRTLEIPRRGNAVADTDGESVDSEEVMHLKEENLRLTEELQLTMDTMGRMLSEYSLMFSGGTDTSLDKDKMREMLASDTKPAEQPAVQEDVEKTTEPVAESIRDEHSDPGDASVEDEGLKALDEELAMLDLTEEELSGVADLDETVVVPLDQSDEVVDLDDVLDDSEQK
ncbi:hypothetical protein [Sedimenticola selenatireducens]|uniref:Uncharacterized protein n=1 Tax=Sedimenticola selenatireducens TaxID=191960 RepID=A0A558DWX7_9GAMM|nr:hypothetical protein [Sedimenticola selenatireducens]TVO75517.1 hypothetical protein FHP88_08465 [Sedimenticola selenatireducens]TVT65423.1 MAG: hypothetical protein FHK78_04250 [Sedimenticola selenatireducens]